MRIRYNHLLDNSPHVYDVRGNFLRIGRAADNEIALNSPFIPDRAVEMIRTADGWELLVVSGICVVDDKDLHVGDRRTLTDDCRLSLGPFTLAFEFPRTARKSENQRLRELDDRLSEVVMAVHLELLEKMDLQNRGLGDSGFNEEFLLTLERNIEEIARLQEWHKPANEALVLHIAGHALRSELLNGMLAKLQSAPDSLTADRHWSRIVSIVADRERELVETNGRIAKRLELAGLAGLTERLEAVDRKFWDAYVALADGVHRDFREYLAFRYLKKQVKDIVFGYGPLEDLLRTPTISEIMVVDRDHIYIEKDGVLENSGRRFTSDEVTTAIIDRIVSRVGRRIDKSQPLVDARLADGSRVNAVIPPLAVSGPCLTIRKFPARRMGIADLVAKRSLTGTTAAFLKAAVLSRANILIAGGTGSGKTTLLNCLSDFIPDKERIVTIEDTAELQLAKEHVVRLETKIANVEGRGEYTIRDLVKNSLRMRPDRIVVGECRAAEALDMLQAMNTGHDGSMTTIHANNAADVVLRLEVLVQMAADLPIQSIHRQIASAVDLIVQTARLRDGSRRITQIAEVVDYDERNACIRLKDLFLLETVAGKPKLLATGCLPTFIDRIIETGLLDLSAFYLDEPTTV
jgi:pilus assembly protein CpaF